MEHFVKMSTVVSFEPEDENVPLPNCSSDGVLTKCHDPFGDSMFLLLTDILDRWQWMAVPV